MFGATQPQCTELIRFCSPKLQHHQTPHPNQEPGVDRLHAVRVDGELRGRMQSERSNASAPAAGVRNRPKLQG